MPGTEKFCYFKVFTDPFVSKMQCSQTSVSGLTPWGASESQILAPWLLFGDCGNIAFLKRALITDLEKAMFPPPGPWAEVPPPSKIFQSVLKNFKSGNFSAELALVQCPCEKVIIFHLPPPLKSPPPPPKI